jgi:phenylacetic acid degradation operon negative regulatory protein
MDARRNTMSPGADRPRLTARSVIASTLLGLDPPQLQTPALIAGTELFGIRSGTARVALSRMVAAGELESVDDGYRLAGPLLRRRARQDLSRRGAPETWEGMWACAVAPGDPRPADERAELRAAMHALRYATIRDGAWMRPSNLPSGVLVEAERRAARSTIATVGRVADGEAIARQLWDLDAWVDGADALAREIEPLQRRLDRDDASALAPSFVAAAACLRHLQADPLLPAELLPRRWPGHDLRDRQQRFDASFRAVLRAWHLAR